MFYSAGTALAILDVFRNGRAGSPRTWKDGVFLPAARTSATPRAGRADGSAPEALSDDGRTVLLSELLSGAGKSGSTNVP